ncbi:MAG: HAMP domain-containing histidine kinase [Lachnospiraceae bacterium]|nr:HAMP domain-containing histidine kinase [Lachnospiraceae bacterium]MCI9602371.1 HAMP domain-containing histidine kinase [Lachnospiraceae bacterium]MDE6896776.1 HAMP domain-containing histidine kinase [Lachnospiraceae bacterium]
MYLKIFAFICLSAAVLSVSASLYVLHRTKKQIADMSDILEEIRGGNGNRRILSGTFELTAPLAWQINAIVRSYEEQLSLCRQTEETNKRLMTSLSHDVRTPLTTLIGYLDAVHRGIVAGAERDDYVETARKKAHDLKEYIDVLFDWFKLGSGEFSMHMAMTDLTGLTRELLVDWIPILEERQIEYIIQIPEQPFRAEVDPDAFLRILNNLIQNVLVHSQADRVEISLSRQNQKIILTVSDNGTGMEKEDLKHIFERLYKCDRGRTQKGSGLGLSIVQQLMEKMGGKIDAESTPGQGTVFILFFPSSG